MGLVAVKDPELLAQLEGPAGLKPVTDERVLFELENGGKRSTDKEVGRQIGLTARAGLQGIGNVLSLPGTIYDAGADAVGALMPKRLSDLIGSGKGFRFNSPQAVSALLTKAGLPEPENATERVVQDAAGSMAGQGPVMAMGRSMANAAGPVVSRVGELLAARPAAQIVGAGGAGGGAGTAREGGAGPVGQTVAGLIGGFVSPVAADVATQGARAVGRGAVGAVKPFTKSGREEVVGTTIRRLASDPDRAATELDSAAELVPGSQPTTAQAARDPGLLTAERAIRSGQSGPQFAERASQQNKARNVLLNSLAGNDTGLNAAITARRTEGNALYEPAMAQSVKPDDALISLAQRPAFTRAMTRAQEIAAEQGLDLGNPQNTVRGLHYVKMALDDALDTSTLSGIGKTQQRAISQTRDALLEWLDKAAPDYGKARAAYEKASGPVNQLEALQDVRGRVLNAGTDAVTGERIMSPAKFYNAVTKPEARSELAKVLRPEQLKTLDAIAADLDRGALSESAGRAAGSNTYQNVSTAYVLGRALGGKTPDSPMMQNLMRPLAWLNKLNEPALQQLLTDAMLDPAIARSLMGKSSPRAVESVALELSQRARALGLGTATQQGTQDQSRAQ